MTAFELPECGFSINKYKESQTAGYSVLTVIRAGAANRQQNVKKNIGLLPVITSRLSPNRPAPIGGLEKG